MLDRYTQASLAALEHAPRYDQVFVQHMRDQLGDQNLDIVWDAIERRLRPTTLVESAACPMLFNRGCWVLVSYAGTTLVDAGECWTPVRHMHVIRILHGEDGFPQHPGPWLIERMHALDIRRHGRAILDRHDQIRAADMESRHNSVREFADFTSKDDETKRGARKEADAKGISTPSKDEYAVLRAKIDKRHQAILDRRAREISEAQFHQDGTVKV